MGISITDAEVGTYTRNTRVVLSFGAAGGGFQFSLALRAAIYEKRYNARYGQGDPGLVYMDTASIMDEGHTTWNWNQKVQEWSGKNEFWKAFWTGGLINASTMIFIITQPWLKSENCGDEFALYRAQFAKNSKLMAIFVVFPDAKSDWLSGPWSAGVNNARTFLISQASAAPGATSMLEKSKNPAGGLMYTGKTISVNYDYACSEHETDQIVHACVI